MVRVIITGYNLDLVIVFLPTPYIRCSLITGYIITYNTSSESKIEITSIWIKVLG